MSANFWPRFVTHPYSLHPGPVVEKVGQVDDEPHQGDQEHKDEGAPPFGPLLVNQQQESQVKKF